MQTRSENIAFIINYTSGTPEQLAQVKTKLDQLHDYKLREMVADIKTRVAEESSRMAGLKYNLAQNGLDVKNSWPLVEAKLGPFFTMEQFVQAYGQDAQFRQTLTWRSEPLALYRKQHAAQAEAEAREQATQEERNQKERALFAAAVRELARHGVNVSNCDANFELTKEHLHWLEGRDFNVENVIDAIKNAGLAFSQNDPQQVQSMDQQDRNQIYDSIKPRLAYRQDLIAKAKEKIAQLSIAELRSRIDACSTLANDYSKDPRAQDPIFSSWFASIYSTADLQNRAEVVLHNRKLRSMTPAQLKVEADAARPQPQHYEFPQLPPEYYDGYKIVASSAPQIKELLRRYGREQVDAAINRYKTLQTSYNQGDSYTRF